MHVMVGTTILAQRACDRGETAIAHDLRSDFDAHSIYSQGDILAIHG